MTLPEIRWKDAWTFLSLDAISALWAPLWLDAFPRERFVAVVRDGLTRWIAGNDADLGFGAVHHALCRRLAAVFGDTSTQIVGYWVREVFIFEGRDRFAEDAWTWVMEDLDEAGEDDLSERVAEQLRLVNVDRRRAVAALDESIAAAKGKPPSEWDLRIRAADGRTVDGALDTAWLICSANAFVTAWEAHCNQLSDGELLNVYRWGLRAARKGRMESDLVFPGVWRFESTSVGASDRGGQGLRIEPGSGPER